jgi:xanthine dehydrogenase YagS FAD-binding subunit
MNQFILADCKTIPEVLQELSSGSVIKAGGTDLLDRMKAGIEDPRRLVSIHNVASLRGIRQDNDGVTLGPLVTLAEIASHPLLQSHFTALADAARQVATSQIRNVATLGGNLLQRSHCWYYRSSRFLCKKKGGLKCFALDGLNQYHAIFNNDICPTVSASSIAVALYVLGATIEITSHKEKRTLPIHQLYLEPNADPRREHTVAPDELITSIHIPQPSSNSRSAYQQYGEKQSFDWPIADAGVLLDIQSGICRKAIIVMGSASPTPRHAVHSQNLLIGHRITEELARSAGQLAVQGATPLSMNGYKVQALSTAVYRTILLAAEMMERDPTSLS